MNATGDRRVLRGRGGNGSGDAREKGECLVEEGRERRKFRLTARLLGATRARRVELRGTRRVAGWTDRSKRKRERERDLDQSTPFETLEPVVGPVPLVRQRRDKREVE